MLWSLAPGTKTSARVCFLIKAESLANTCIGKDARCQVLGCLPPGTLSAWLQELLVQRRQESNRSSIGKLAAVDPATYSEGDPDHDKPVTKP